MIGFDDARHIHQILIEKHGGTSGIRDRKALDAAISRPKATFDGKDLYPDAVSKAAAIIESIVTNHPFVDGNKRTGYVLMRLLLLEARVDIDATEEEKYVFVIHISEGKSDFKSIKSWIEEKLKHLP